MNHPNQNPLVERRKTAKGTVEMLLVGMVEVEALPEFQRVPFKTLKIVKELVDAARPLSLRVGQLEVQLKSLKRKISTSGLDGSCDIALMTVSDIGVSEIGDSDIGEINSDNLQK